jgi:hypothetical protein
MGSGGMIYNLIFVAISLGNPFLESVVLVLSIAWIYEVSR